MTEISGFVGAIWAIFVLVVAIGLPVYLMTLALRLVKSVERIAVALENGARTDEGVAMPAFCSTRNDETSGTLAPRLRPDAVAATSESELTGYHVTPWNLGGERESGRKSTIFP